MADKRSLGVFDHTQILRKAYDADLGVLRTSDINNLVRGEWNYVAVTYPDTVTEVYTYKTAALLGDVIAVVTITYSDASKEQLTSVQRS